MKRAELIWQMAVVRRGEDGCGWLEFSDPGGCSKCSSGTGCGAALFSRLFSRPDARLPLPSGKAIPSGHLVRVGLDPRWLMLAAVVTYLLPVVAFVTGAVFADRIAPGSDPAALVSGTSFALAAGLLARFPLKLVGAPRLVLVDLHENLESAGDSGHFVGQGS